MTPEQERLLLATARILRRQLSIDPFVNREDLAWINDALKPFDTDYDLRHRTDATTP